MKDNSHFCILFVSIIVAVVINGLFVSSTSIFLSFATTYLDQPLQQNHQDLQSAINNQVQQTITDTINNNNNNNNSNHNNHNNNSYVNNTVNSQGQSNTSLTPFQEKTRIIDDTPSQKIRVGDIDIAYKQFGQGSNPIVLINGLGATMGMWSPNLIERLSTSNNNTIIIFDNRGSGESTIGTKEFSISQFANDTIGLLDALNIQKADILGWSMGTFIAQELTLLNPDRVKNLILYASNCGGPETVPPNPKVIQTIQTTSNYSLNPAELEQNAIPLLFPSQWVKSNPNYQDYFRIPAEAIDPDLIQMQNEAIANWNGVCSQLTKITQPTLIITGTEDIPIPAANSLILVDKIPGAWLIQIRDAGHGLMYQYPEIFDNVVMTFLNINDVERSNSNSTITR